MAIKVTLGATENTQQEKPFPKLMVSTKSNIIVFMLSKGVGVSLSAKAPYEFGYYTDEWASDNFTDYNEPITIQNL
jgi:hypothetical protein